MSAMKYYTVEEEREVKVRAETPAQAIQIASAVLRAADRDGDEGNVNIQGPVVVKGINAREDY